MGYVNEISFVVIWLNFNNSPIIPYFYLKPSKTLHLKVTSAVWLFGETKMSAFSHLFHQPSAKAEQKNIGDTTVGSYIVVLVTNRKNTVDFGLVFISKRSLIVNVRVYAYTYTAENKHESGSQQKWGDPEKFETLGMPQDLRQSGVGIRWGVHSPVFVWARVSFTYSMTGCPPSSKETIECLCS